MSDGPTSVHSIIETGAKWPSMDDFVRTMCLSDYNTRVVVIGTTLLGLAAGVVGTFAYLRKRALMGDALSHATLPGIAIVFLLLGTKELPWLLFGAAVSGVLGVLAVVALRHVPRIREDAAIGIVLSVFFGVGMVLFSLIQQLRSGNEAGLSNFIYGKAAAMLASDARLIGGMAVGVVSVCLLLYKEFRVVCFDPAYAATQGYSVSILDLAMMAMVVITTVVGLQAVGLILVVALLIIPAAAARFWTDRLGGMTALAALFGAVSGWLGASISSLLPRLPTGAVIVLCAGALFLVSLFFAPQRGVVAGVWRRRMLRQRVGRQHLLRALIEREELDGTGAFVPVRALSLMRSWGTTRLTGIIRRAEHLGDVVRRNGSVRLTEKGRTQALRILRNHRLWELYLIRYADVALAEVDHDADEVEHVLSGPIVRELEMALAAESARVPPSPHPLGMSAP